MSIWSTNESATIVVSIRITFFTFLAQVRVEANFPQVGGPSSEVARRYEAELIGVPITGKGGEDAAVAYLSMR